MRSSLALSAVWIACIGITLVQNVHSSWWYLGMAGTTYQATMTSSGLPFRSKCSQIAVLEPHQRELCGKSRNVLDVVSKGASMGIDECQWQFQDRRWNCTTFNTTNVFGQVLSLKSREKAYIYAISSAGVMHAITKSCSKGELGMCECDNRIRDSDTEGEFIWGGCSHNVRFGDKFTGQFVDLNENRLQPDGLMNLWNNKAGRKSIKSNTKLVCKCHGVSGSCSAKICWRTMLSFREVGNMLKDRFDGASRVKFNLRKQRLSAMDRQQKKPSKNDLVYLQESPDFCEINRDLGSLGTRGRLCNRTSYGMDGCALMCCGRGYYTSIWEIEVDCNCKFIWCCRVECHKCKKTTEQHYCN